MYAKCRPTSKEKLRSIAKNIRKLYNVSTIYFPIYDILEKNHDEGTLTYEVVADDDNILLKNELAKYLLDERTIIMKECVYKEFVKDIERTRFTLTHEFSHYVLLTVLGWEITFQETPLEAAYYSPEWQANTLTVELLCPYEETKNFTLKQLMEECHISEECAIIVLKLRGALNKKEMK